MPQKLTVPPGEKGAQRLSLEKLREYESWAYGLFLCFGMTTFDGEEFSEGDKPSTHYAPTHLDVSQWVSVARDAGMKYMVLTAKHVAGHCLWPSKLTDYHVGTSGDKTDVMEKYVEACAQSGIKPGVYYCAWDNGHRLGSRTPSDVDWAGGEGINDAYTSHEYEEFQLGQITELLTNYGPIAQLWIDIPAVMSRGARQRLYDHAVGLQNECIVMFNQGKTNGAQIDMQKAWPTDVLTMERNLPPSEARHVKWRFIEGKWHYVPGEVNDCLGQEWFYLPDDPPRSDFELLGMWGLARTRGANFLLSVPPDTSGQIPSDSIEALQRLRRNIERIGSENDPQFALDQAIDTPGNRILNLF